MIRKRQQLEKQRIAASERRKVSYFHQADDPYSNIMLQALPLLKQHYDIDIEPELVSPPPNWAAPERKMLIQYSRLDGERLATKAGLQFQDPGGQPDANTLAETTTALQTLIAGGAFIDEGAKLSAQLWQRAKPGYNDFVAETIAPTGDEKRTSLGHYLGATCYYQGEWYWGLDRLHYLQTRLQQEGAGEAAPIFAPPVVAESDVLSGQNSAQGNIDIDFFLSFRSPYTYIATERIKKLANAYGARLKLKFVLPMVMRNLPVPQTKGRYIIHDVAREARFHQIPFGLMADPVGKPVERGYSLLPWAVDNGLGYEYCLSFLRSVWAEGVDAGSNKGLQHIVTAAGLDWQEGKKQLGNNDWRQEAEANRQELIDLNIWGVPSFKVGAVATWGQDRLWVVEDALRQACGLV